MDAGAIIGLQNALDACAEAGLCGNVSLATRDRLADLQRAKEGLRVTKPGDLVELQKALRFALTCWPR